MEKEIDVNPLPSAPPSYQDKEDDFSSTAAAPPPGNHSMNDFSSSAPSYNEVAPLIAELGKGEQCAFCQERVAPESMIQPCLCTNVVHRRCLDIWRSTSPNPSDFHRCPACSYEYQTEEVSPPEGCTPMAKFKLAVLRDSVLLLILSVGLMMLLGWVILPAADVDGWRFRWYPNRHIVSVFAMDFVSGIVLYFALLAVVGACVFMVRACACACCCQCCHDEGSDAYTRTYTPQTYRYGPDPFIWWWFYPIPTPMYHHHHHHGGCASCIGCGSMNCSGGSGGGGNDAGLAVLIIILVLAVIGVIMAMVILVILFQRVVARHRQISIKYNEALAHQVIDRRLHV